MITQKNLIEAKEIIKDFFNKTSFNVEIEIEKKENIIFIGLKIEEPKILIGVKGKTLFFIQHLLKKILQKKTKEKIFIDLDINDYKKKKIEFLKEKARLVANEVFLTKKQRALEPMSAYERRIVHLELASYQGIITESLGQEPRRMIIIQPEFEKEEVEDEEKNTGRTRDTGATR